MEQQAAWRLTAFIIGLLFFIALETYFSKRKQNQPKLQRLARHFSLSILGTFLTRLLLPLLPVSAALWAEQKGWGVLNYLELKHWVFGVLAFVVLDLVIYWQHRCFHYFPILWRLHRMHHSDTELDASSGIRFHPIEIFLSSILKIIVVILLGAPALFVLLFEIVLNLTSLFTHTNMRLPQSFEKKLRYFIVTPDMHRIHHSVDEKEHNKNFCFNLSCWDRLFGSYLDKAAEDQMTMRMGLEKYRSEKSQRLVELLRNPWST